MANFTEMRISRPENRASGAIRSVESRRNRDSFHPATAEIDYSADEVEFAMAMDDYRRRTGNRFPTASQTLRVIRKLGYAKPAQIDEIDLGFRVDIAEFASLTPRDQVVPPGTPIQPSVPLNRELLAKMYENLSEYGVDFEDMVN